MKRICLIGLLLLTGCYEHIPAGIWASIRAEQYMDNLYGKTNVGDKISIGDITLKDYLSPLKQQAFQKDTVYHLSEAEWDVFTKKSDSILKGNVGKNGYIVVENYRIHERQDTTAFFVDSATQKVSVIYDFPKK